MKLKKMIKKNNLIIVDSKKKSCQALSLHFLKKVLYKNINWWSYERRIFTKQKNDVDESTTKQQ